MNTSKKNSGYCSVVDRIYKNNILKIKTTIMKHLTLLLTVFILFSCKKEFSDEYNVKPEIEGEAILYPIERKEINGKYATAIKIAKRETGIAYYLVDKKDSLLETSIIKMDISRNDLSVKTDVFTTFSLKDRRSISFIANLASGYIAFSNWCEWINEQYWWIGRHGSTHLNNGSQHSILYDLLSGKPVGNYTAPKFSNREDIRGGSCKTVNGIIHYFAAIYKSGENKFLRLSLFKSIDGINWGNEIVLLYCNGTNGGIDETFFTRFNFYGEPLYSNGKLRITWFEHNSQGTWRTNYLYSEDGFATWTNVNVPQQQGIMVGEASIEEIPGVGLITMGRQDAKSPQYQSLCINGVWQNWTRTNIGSGAGRVMSAMKWTKEHGLVVVYGDRGTGHMKISLNNTVNNVLSGVYNEGKILFTTPYPDAFQPLGYPCIMQDGQYSFLVGFSIEKSDREAIFYTGHGTFINYE